MLLLGKVSCVIGQDVEDRGCTVRLGWARDLAVQVELRASLVASRGYAALVFLILYTYNALEVLLDTIWPQAQTARWIRSL